VKRLKNVPLVFLPNLVKVKESVIFAEAEPREASDSSTMDRTPDLLTIENT
jgi:hypothetical protein